MLCDNREEPCQLKDVTEARPKVVKRAHAGVEPLAQQNAGSLDEGLSRIYNRYEVWCLQLGYNCLDRLSR